MSEPRWWWSTARRVLWERAQAWADIERELADLRVEARILRTLAEDLMAQALKVKAEAYLPSPCTIGPPPGTPISEWCRCGHIMAVHSRGGRGGVWAGCGVCYALDEIAQARESLVVKP